MQRNLIIIYRSEDYARDFEEIAQKVFALDPDITTYLLEARTSQHLPADAWRHPTLVVAMNATFRFKIQRGHVISNRVIPKLDQASRARAAGISVPPALKFEFGMKLDPILFGSHVILKPMSITSSGAGVHLVRRIRAEQLRTTDFDRGHPIHHDREGYLVQRFVDTGLHPSWNRVITFLGEPIYAAIGSLLRERPSLDAPDEVLAAATVAIQGSERQRMWKAEVDTVAAARQVGEAFADIPLLAIDFLRDVKTGKLWFLECNPGGNTWHFSSDQKGGVNLRMELGEAWLNGEAKANILGRLRMIEQFGAWDVCARALVARTHALAV